MRNKLVWKLSAYFSASLLAFACVVGALFFVLFRSRTIEIYKTDLQARADAIAETLSSLPSFSGPGKGQNGGYGAYIKILNDIAMDDVWIVDEDLNIITYGMRQHPVKTTGDLPVGAKAIVDEVFSGKTEFSYNFDSLLDAPSLTVGTPIRSGDAVITGVVLLHSPISGIDLAVSNGSLILAASVLAALIAAIVLSIRLSYIFTGPLHRMNLAAIRLAEGDYSAKTEITQHDEIGTLAGNMDILADKLQEAAKEREKLEKLRKDFVANISHELKTPITVIRGSLEALNDGIVADSAQVREYYGQMLAETRHLQRLVQDLLELSRLENPDFQLEMQEISLCDVLSDVLRSVKSLAAEKELEISYENRAANCIMLGDYGRIRQMILIVLDNAVKFSPKHGRLLITLAQDEKTTLSIRDEGPGIPEQDLPFIFDRFYRTKSPENTTGTGLGLAIAKQIAVRHDIGAEAFSEEGRGCEFRFSFPILRCTPPSRP